MPKPIILLVDDEEDLLSVLETAVEHRLPQYEVTTAHTIDLAQAWLDAAHVRTDSLALVMVDHRIGRSSGLELLKAVRDRFPAVHRLMYTGQATPQIEAAVVEAGGQVLWKPLRLTHLLDAIESTLNQA